jgi:hypothetical protein
MLSLCERLRACPFFTLQPLYANDIHQIIRLTFRTEPLLILAWLGHSGLPYYNLGNSPKIMRQLTNGSMSECQAADFLFLPFLAETHLDGEVGPENVPRGLPSDQLLRKGASGTPSVDCHREEALRWGGSNHDSQVERCSRHKPIVRGHPAQGRQDDNTFIMK